MTATAPSKLAVDLYLHGRTYGLPRLTIKERVKKDSPPEIGLIFIEDIVKSSRIQALPEDADHETIFAAYGEDVNSLAARRVEADEFLCAVLYCGMEGFSVDPNRREDQMHILRKQLEPLGILPSMDLSAEKCALPAKELVFWIKAQFRAEVDNIARRVATALHILADHHVVGLVEWQNPTVCKFHYFTWNTEHSSETRSKRVGDVNSWHDLVTTIIDSQKLLRTRHTHHVVKAGIHIADDYEKPMPPRVRALIDAAPPWLRPHLTVVDGTETLSEEVTALADQEATTRTVSVHCYDPALALANYALTGWDDAELRVLEEKRQAKPAKVSWAKRLFQRHPVAIPVLILLTLISAGTYGGYKNGHAVVTKKAETPAQDVSGQKLQNAPVLNLGPNPYLGLPH